MSQSTESKIYTDPAQLVAAVGEGRFGRPLVVTNGCFDLIHAGHVRYLERARELGESLIVLVNDDASIGRLKGAERPVMPLDQRLIVMAGLQSVSAVAPFSEDTPARWIERLKPDVLVKGGDWAPDNIAGADLVVASGGRVTTIPFEFETSTSNIIKKIRQLG